MAQFCGNCGTPLRDGAGFCGTCGTKTAARAAATSAPPPPQPQANAPQPPAWNSVPPPSTPPPPGYQGEPAQQVNANPGYNPYAAGAQDGLPPSPPLWDFQKSMVPTGESLAASFGSNPSGFMKLLAWMIRSSFLDPRIARQAALDKGGNMAAIGAFAIAMVPSWLYLLLIGNSFGFGSYYYGSSYLHAVLISTVLIGIIGLVATIFVLSLISKSLLGVSLSAGQLMRALAYAQGAAFFGFIPVLGVLIRLWTIPSSIAAVREISGADTAKAIIFILIGGAITVVAMMALSPILIFGLVRI